MKENAYIATEPSIDLATAKILVVDDVAANRKLLCETLEPEGYAISAAPSGEVALKVAQADPPDLIMLDIMMPGIDGFEVCRRLSDDEKTRSVPIIFITANNDTDALVEGFRVGGVDYITKPFQADEVLTRVKNHLQIHMLTQVLFEKNQRLEEEILRREQAEASFQEVDDNLALISKQEAERWGLENFVGQGASMHKVVANIRKLQKASGTHVLIVGESGTGKELVARAIHFGSTRAKQPFIPVNCAAIPSDLTESLFFGHVRGAFSGAHTDQRGYFSMANRGTLFLDEIGDMPMPLQAKLLRTLEDGRFMPVGAKQEQSVDVRVLAATNANLQEAIKDGRFRKDLYYRLANFVVEIPALRDRREDIPLLVEHFLDLLATEMGRPRDSIHADAMKALEAYPYPGNARELKSIIERAIIESNGRQIQRQHLHLVSATNGAVRPSDLPSAEDVLDSLPLNLEEAQVALTKRALAQTNGNVSKAAELLGINRTKVYRLLAQAGEEKD